MNALLLGSGGREHAIAHAISKSKKLGNLFILPGNAGTAQLGTNLPGDLNNHEQVLVAAKQNGIDLVVVGPEKPLCDGIVDRLAAEGVKVFGPTKAAARIEGDKAYSKELMRRALVPTAEARVFSDYQAARSYVATRDYALVVKAAGLAAGKGVIVCDDPSQGLLALEKIMVDRAFGDAGDTVVVEERLTGAEISVLALVDDTTIYLLETAQDYKKVGEGDTGPNTGGMGTFSPSPLADDKLLDQVQRSVFVPIVDALKSDNITYRGVLYAGIMLTPAGPKVLEFNCRFGDPEAQVIIPRIRSDFLEILDATASGRLADMVIDWDPRAAVCVVLASQGYPGEYHKGKVVTGIGIADQLNDTYVFHAGTSQLGEQVVTNGGRVLGLTALGSDVSAARSLAYTAIEKIDFDGVQFRRDIAAI